MLHIALHAAPTAALEQATPADWQSPLPVTFEAALAALETLPQMFCEPDGWFDWTSPPTERTWQIAGQMHDRGATLGHVEMKLTGAVPSERFTTLLTVFGWPEQPLAVQLVREARLISVDSLLQQLQQVGQ